MTYWIVIDGVQAGPMSLEELLSHPALEPETPVWHDGLPDWTVARLVPEIAVKFHASDGEAVPPQPTPPMDGAPFRYGDTCENQAPPQQPPMPNYNNYGPYYNYNNAPNCYQPGSCMPPDMRNQRPMPQNYLVWAILVTICCCQLFGIIAIVYAAQVSPAYYRGDYDRAEKMSGNAATWVIVSVVAGLIFYPFWMLYSIMVAMV